MADALGAVPVVFIPTFWAFVKMPDMQNEISNRSFFTWPED